MEKKLSYDILEKIGCEDCELSYIENEKDFLIVDSWESLEKIVEYFELESDNELDNITEWGFYDEYMTCYDCGKAIRIVGDSYHWKPNFEYTEDGLFCSECLDEDEIIQLKVNDFKNANTILTDEQLENEGFTKQNEDTYINGFDFDDNPEEIFNKLKDKFNEILFSIYNNSQFYTEFDVWARNKEEE